MTFVRSRRLIGAIAFSAAAAAFLASAPIAGAQSCPTSGAGTTCFGGQLYCASSGQCYNQPTCAANQVMDCSACGCVCNTSLYPCGGCTAASSTSGASCGGNAACPTGGTYQNQCSVVGCPSGTTICPSPAPGRCVANRTCPAGTTWDVCTDTCGTPNVLLSPGFVQNGFISISGEVRSSAGNLRLDSATGANQGDVYMANGKAFRVDGSGATQLTVGNYGVGGTAANLRVLGAVLGSGISAIAGDTSAVSGALDATQICFGNGINCRTSWPASADFDPAYVNVTGDAMTGPLSIATSTAFNASALDVGNAGSGTGLSVSTSSGLNGIAALRVTNAGAGAGIDVTGGSAGNGAFIKGSGSNVALEVASYNYPGANTVGTVMQVRRGPGSGIAPAAGMGAQIGFPLQSDSAGSYSQGGALGAVVSSASPWKTDMFFSTVSGSTMSEKMRVTADGRVGIGTTAPDRSLTVANATGANYVNVKDGAHELLMGVDATGGIISVMTNHDLALRAGGNSEKMRVTAGGNVGIGATAPAAKLSVGGNGADVYATDLWVEDNMHVQGNEAMAQGGGRGRLRVGTAWGYPGLYAEGASNGWNTDLVLGASSDHVLINAGSFGRPGAGATLELWGSRISDTGGGTLHIQSGGGVVAFDGGDTVVVNNGLQLGGVTRSSWPSLSVINTSATLYTWQGAGWKSVSCPAGYGLTGWSGYNCKSNGGEWECSSAYMHSTYVDVWYSAEANAYVSINCAALN